MSADLDKATTRNLLDGLRSFAASFQSQRELSRIEETRTLTESKEHHRHAVYFSDVLPRLQCYSFVTLLAVVIEARVTVFCDRLRMDHALPKGVDDLDGSFLQRARGYLRDFARVEPPSDLWRWMTDLFRVRDCIVSGAGKVDTGSHSEQRELNQIARRRPGLSIVPDDLLFNRAPHLTLRRELVLHIDSEFCVEAVTSAQGLFGYLYQHRDPIGG